MGRGGTVAAQAPAGAGARWRTLGGVLPIVGFGLPLLAVLVAILVIGPYYGIVDDGIALGLVRSVGDQGFFHAYGHLVWDDARVGGQVRLAFRTNHELYPSNRRSEFRHPRPLL